MKLADDVPTKPLIAHTDALPAQDQQIKVQRHCLKMKLRTALPKFVVCAEEEGPEEGLKAAVDERLHSKSCHNKQHNLVLVKQNCDVTD